MADACAPISRNDIFTFSVISSRLSKSPCDAIKFPRARRADGHFDEFNVSPRFRDDIPYQAAAISSPHFDELAMAQDTRLYKDTRRSRCQATGAYSDILIASWPRNYRAVAYFSITRPVNAALMSRPHIIHNIH